MKKPKIFLSHNSKDKPLVLRVDRALKNLKFDSWLDSHEIAPGENLVHKIFYDGIKDADYVCVFLTSNSASSHWVTAELEIAFMLSLEKKKPRIFVLQFEDAVVPIFLKNRRYERCNRHEFNHIIHCISRATGRKKIEGRSLEDPSVLDFHAAHETNNEFFFLGSERDPLDVVPFRDPEGVPFYLRNLYLVRFDKAKMSFSPPPVMLTSTRFAHCAIFSTKDRIFIFYNRKIDDNSFNMTGTFFAANISTLVPNECRDVFFGVNCGWNPFFDEKGNVYHADSGTRGNPAMKNGRKLKGRNWNNFVTPLFVRNQKINAPSLDYEYSGKEGGYVYFINVDSIVSARQRHAL